MAQRHDLIFPQDIEAYVDGAVTGDRRRAVEARLLDDHRELSRAMAMLRTNIDLQRMKRRIYEDPELRAAMDAVLKRRETKKQAAG